MTRTPHPIPERPLPIDWDEVHRMAWSELPRRDMHGVFVAGEKRE
jgi:hypothetical protein